MSAHAILSASGAFRWLQCPPSALLEREFKDKPSDAAAEGNAAHALAEHKLRRALKLRSKKPVSQYDSEEMDEHTNNYVGFVLEKIELAKQTCCDPLVLIEQKLDLSKYVPDGFGTADCIIVADDVLHVIDFKYGMGVVVSAISNPQMKLYALGALDLFEGLYDINTVSMTIYQPRRENISTDAVLKGALYDWANDVLRPTAALAIKGEGDFQPGEHCRFCRASVQCRARADEQLKLAANEFALPPLLTDEEINSLLGNLDSMVAWANEIKKHALHSAIQGKKWEGFKIVEGRTNRRYINEDNAAKAAQEAGYKDIYKQSLITLTEMQTLMGKKKFDEILGAFIVKPKGKPILVPESDKRLNYGVRALKEQAHGKDSAKNDFDNPFL